MADLTVTPGSVVPGADARTIVGVFGATIVQGKSVYKDPADSKWKLADANVSQLTAGGPAGGTEPTVGVALTSGVDGQPGVIHVGGLINPGGTVVVGTIYVISATAGGIAPHADLLTGLFATILGVGISASQIRMPQAGPFVSGVAVP
jgi:hypothetical protein